MPLDLALGASMPALRQKANTSSSSSPGSQKAIRQLAPLATAPISTQVTAVPIT